VDYKVVDDLYIVKAKARDKYGRSDESTGAVVIGNLKGEMKANAIMKAETKAKRRVTLSICGMGWADETEVQSIPGARPVDVDLSTGEIKGELAPSQEPALQVEVSVIDASQIEELNSILDNCDEKYQKWFSESVKKMYGSIAGVPSSMFERMKSAAIKKRAENQARIDAEEAGMRLEGEFA